MDRRVLAVFAACALMGTGSARADVVCTSEFRGAGYGSGGWYETTCSDGRERFQTRANDDRNVARTEITQGLAPQGFRLAGSFYRGRYVMHVKETRGTAKYCLLARGVKAWRITPQTFLDCSDRTVVEIEDDFVEQHLTNNGLSLYFVPYTEPKAVFAGSGVTGANLQFFKKAAE